MFGYIIFGIKTICLLYTSTTPPPTINVRPRTAFVVSKDLELRHVPYPRTLSPPPYVGPSHVCENDFNHEAKRKRGEEGGEKESTRHVVLQVSFVVICSELHRTDSR